MPLVWVYFTNRHAGAWYWAVPATGLLRVAVYAGLLFAFVLVVASNLRPSPAAVVPGEAKPAGAYLLTRHPLMTGFTLIGLLHLPMNGAASDVAFFGGAALFPLVGAWHQDQRKLASGDPKFRAFYEATPFFLLTGRETLRGLREPPAPGLGARPGPRPLRPLAPRLALVGAAGPEGRQHMALLLKNVAFTFVLPGTLGVYLPLWIAQGPARPRASPVPWRSRSSRSAPRSTPGASGTSRRSAAGRRRRSTRRSASSCAASTGSRGTRCTWASSP